MTITSPMRSLPDDILENIASFLGTSITASKNFGVKASKIPYIDIFESFCKELGEDKCKSLIDDLASRHIRLISDEHKLKGICFDIANRCKLLPAGEAYLTQKDLGPIFCASSYREIEKWIADENLLLICPRLLGEAWNGIEGDHAQRARIAREIMRKISNDITEINLSGLQLTQVPPEVFNFRNLLSLKLCDNKLTSFNPPDEAFPTLEILDLKNNQLTSFNPPAEAFPTLEVLDLENNQLTSFTAAAGAFPTLESLLLNGNKLTTFTAVPGALPTLQELNLENNQLTTFTAGAGDFPTLEILFLKNNQLTTFTAAAGAFPTLESLLLNGNKLTTFTAAAGDFPTLQELNLDNNQLTIFTAAAGDFPTLKTLFLKNNQLTIFTAAPGAFPTLQNLNLDNNQLTILNLHTILFPTLQRLFIRNNSMRIDFERNFRRIAIVGLPFGERLRSISRQHLFNPAEWQAIKDVVMASLVSMAAKMLIEKIKNSYM